MFYSPMISGFRNLQNMESSTRLAQENEEGTPCDLQVYTTLVSGLLKGQLLFASDLYIMPDLITFSVLNYMQSFQ